MALADVVVWTCQEANIELWTADCNNDTRICAPLEKLGETSALMTVDGRPELCGGYDVPDNTPIMARTFVEYSTPDAPLERHYSAYSMAGPLPILVRRFREQ